MTLENAIAISTVESNDGIWTTYRMPSNFHGCNRSVIAALRSQKIHAFTCVPKDVRSYFEGVESASVLFKIPTV